MALWSFLQVGLRIMYAHKWLNDSEEHTLMVYNLLSLYKGSNSL